MCGSACDSQVKFDYEASSTFVDKKTTTSITFATGVGVDPVINNDYVLYLLNGTDTVSVGGIVVKDLELFLITDQTPQFNIDPFSGIQGLGSQPGSLFGALVDQGLPGETDHQALLTCLHLY